MSTIQRAAVLGKPIAHSLSPVLHEAAYQSLGLHDWAYGKIEVGEDDLPAFVNDLDDSWRGLSLTMPLKRTIQPFGNLDWRSTTPTSMASHAHSMMRSAPYRAHSQSMRRL